MLIRSDSGPTDVVMLAAALCRTLAVSGTGTADIPARIARVAKEWNS